MISDCVEFQQKGMWEFLISKHIKKKKTFFYATQGTKTVFHFKLINVQEAFGYRMNSIIFIILEPWCCLAPSIIVGCIRNSTVGFLVEA